ncbi:hypothetical protein [Vibrio parahaemolyticus]|uniref:hypothetical protein n=1 Tax=Vibrio parahaemolyticus TaxID=670 RepID=UPI001ECE8343|nr:hypothetical protein [Vibrio parahaemolyticus]EID0057152.1 hypothetical protein [Vibrio parahaemolyticus]ELK3867035.1 hypothetical protein [Vibrio parahaemolyticus]ELZ1477468.1 hypothetical protein [Vibrio parahaemolyticus]
MVVNIELLHGAVIEYQDTFYLLSFDGEKGHITELFTGIGCKDSHEERLIMQAIIESVTNNA